MRVTDFFARVLFNKGNRDTRLTRAMILILTFRNLEDLPRDRNLLERFTRYFEVLERFSRNLELKP